MRPPGDPCRCRLMVPGSPPAYNGRRRDGSLIRVRAVGTVAVAAPGALGLHRERRLAAGARPAADGCVACPVGDDTEPRPRHRAREHHARTRRAHHGLRHPRRATHLAREWPPAASSGGRLHRDRTLGPGVRLLSFGPYAAEHDHRSGHRACRVGPSCSRVRRRHRAHRCHARDRMPLREGSLVEPARPEPGPLRG